MPERARRRGPVLAALGQPLARHRPSRPRSLSRGLYGTRIAVGVALASPRRRLSSARCSASLAAYRAGAGRARYPRVFDIISSFPSLVLALAVVAVLGPGPVKIIILVAVASSRISAAWRGRRRWRSGAPFLEAERVLGASGARICFVHILPNIVGPLVVLASHGHPGRDHDRGRAVFLGVGVPPPLASWGRAHRRLHLSRPVGLAGAGCRAAC